MGRSSQTSRERGEASRNLKVAIVVALERKISITYLGIVPMFCLSGGRLQTFGIDMMMGHGVSSYLGLDEIRSPNPIMIFIIISYLYNRTFWLKPKYLLGFSVGAYK